MTGSRPHLRLPGFTPRSSSVMVVVCLFLISLLAFAQATHQHLNASEADHCPLCIAIHTVVPVTAAAVAVIFVQVGFSAPVVKARAIVRYWHPQLFTRPPPFPG